MSSNGYLADDELAPIGGGLFLRKDAAASWLRMVAASRRDKVNIESNAKASAYRPRAMQLDMRAHPALYGINPAMNGLPGLPSRHGNGICKDVPFTAPNEWVIEHGPEFGWHRPAATIAINDLNHHEYDPSTDQHRTGTAGDGVLIPEKETDMPGPLFYTPDIVSFPNGYTTSLPHDAWVALKARCDDPTAASMDWASQWLTDLTWQAVRFVEQETAQASAAAVIAALKVSGVAISADVDEAAIARDVIAALPNPQDAANATAAAVVASLPKPPTSFTVTPTA